MGWPRAGGEREAVEAAGRHAKRGSHVGWGERREPHRTRRRRSGKAVASEKCCGGEEDKESIQRFGFERESAATGGLASRMSGVVARSEAHRLGLGAERYCDALRVHGTQ